jgi:hypothetical protein
VLQHLNGLLLDELSLDDHEQKCAYLLQNDGPNVPQHRDGLLLDG